MKYKLLFGLTAFATATVLTGCSDSFGPGNSDRQGRIFPTVGLNADVVASGDAGASPKSRAAMSVNSSQLALDLVSADGTVHQHWNSPDEFPAGEDWPVGAYSMEATYGTPDDEGFGKPYYYGKADFSVRENATTPVSITAQLANSMVSVSFTDNFRKFFQSYSATLLTAGSSSVDYPVDSTEPCYVKPGAVTLQLDVTKFTGVKATLTPSTFTAQPRHHYKLTVDVSAQSGTGVLVLKFDELLDKEDIVIDLSDELLNAPAPTLTPKGFTSGQAMNFIAGSVPADPLRLTLIAHGGISSLTMNTVSTSLTEQGWPAEIDLAAGDAAAAARLKALGLTSVGLGKNPEKMAVVDLTDVVSHIEYLDGMSNVSTFTFRARDQYGKESDEITLSFEIDKLELTLSDAQPVYDGETELSLSMAFNGGSTDNIKFQVRGTNGQWVNTDATITPLSRASQNYSVTAKVPAEGEIHISALLGNKRSNELTVSRAASPYKLVVNNNDVFATHATLNLAENTVVSQSHGRRVLKGADASQATLQLSGDGRTWANASAAVSGSAMKVTGLTAAKEYYARALVDGLPTKPVTFTTEAAVQLPNSGLEEYASTKPKSNCEFFTFSGWGTLNDLTMSQVQDGVNAAYVSSSGTRPESAGHTGNAVLIRTVGWGSGTTAAGGISSIKHVDRGELFLGQWGSEISDNVFPQYGIPFGSRPASLSFWHKFNVVKNHNGYVEIRVFDAAGNEIAANTKEITAQSEWAEITMPLTYRDGCAKAAKLSIVFRSTNKGKPIDGSSMGKSDVNTVSFSSSAVHTGSALYVDDIKLNY